MPSPESPQPVPTRRATPRSTSNLVPPPQPTGASPMSYMTGISFTAGGGFSFGDRHQPNNNSGATPKSLKWGNAPGSYGARFYGEMGSDSSPIPFSSSITMEPSSFAITSSAFNLPMSSSYRRSYASALSGGRDMTPNTLSTSLASLSHHPTGGMGMSYGSYSKSQLSNMMALRTDAELTKQYECCGTQHAGLHALLEHVEDAHPFSDPEANGGGFSPVTLAMDLDMEGVGVDIPEQTESSTSTRSSLSPNLSQAIPNFPPSKNLVPPAGPDLGSSLNQLQLSDVLTSPESFPERRTPFLQNRGTSTSSSSPDNSLPTPSTSSHPSPVLHAPKIHPPNRMGGPFLGAGADINRSKIQQIRFERGFNEVVAGVPVGGKLGSRSDEEPPVTAVAPAVLFASAANMGLPATSTPGAIKTVGAGTTVTAATNGETTPGASSSGTTTPANGLTTTSNAVASGSTAANNDPALPAPSLFTTHKPWRCPNPGCNKAYKQSNGLKYHQQKGVCDFQIHDAVDNGLTIEEAEERSRPFVCAVGSGCNKRYRQMNGLKYHYLNSGEHGEYGLRMIQNGTHPHPPTIPVPPPKTRPFYSNSNFPPSTLSSGTTTTGFHPSSTLTRPTGSTAGAPYSVPTNRPGTSSTTTNGNTNGNVNGNGNGNSNTSSTTTGPRLGTWPNRPTPPRSGSGIASGLSSNPSSTSSANKSGSFAHPAQKPLPPVQRGREAVLFSALPDTDV